MKAYVAWKSHLVRNLAGEQVISRGIVYVIHDRALTHKDRIKIGTIEYVVLDIREGKDFSVDHQEVHIQ